MSSGVERCRAVSRGCRVGTGCRGVELVSRFGVEVSRPGLRHRYDIRLGEVCSRPRERPAIHTSAVWSGRGRAVWVSHPGQVGDRAGQLCGSMRAGQYGRAGQGRAGQLGS